MGTAAWRGTPLAPLLAEAGPADGAREVVFTGLDRGLEGVAGAQAIFEVGGWMIRNTMANRILNLSWRQFARSLSPLWIAQGIFVLVVIALRKTLLVLLAATAIRLPVGLILSTVAYFVIVLIALPGLLTTLCKGVMQSFAHGVARNMDHR